MSVEARQRHTRAHRCPVCGGADGDPRGKGKRCSGFTSADAEWAHCSRDELAGGLEQEAGGTYAHRLHGPCKCGSTHGESTRAVGREVVATYVYESERGAPLFRVVRTAGKGFLQQHPDGAGGWDWGRNGTAPTLYRLPLLVEDDGDRPVYIVEGEKDVETLTKRGYTATTNPGGAGKWHHVADLAKTVLQGRDVIVIADADEVGRRHAREVASTLQGIARSVQVLECPGPHKDVSDLLLAGGSLEQLVPIDGERTKQARATTLVERARALRVRGPVRRVPSGIATLDKACRGGFAMPRLVVVGGAPGAGKTALVVWLALTLAQTGVQVVILAVDEGADDVLLRLALLLGLDVERLEAGDSSEWDRLESMLAPLPIALLDGDDGWTIETASAHLAAAAKGAPGVLVVDSAQTADAEGTAKADSPRARADAVVKSLKHVVRSNPFLVLATSELARGAYRSRNNAERISDISAFKESGAIEYAAQTALVLRSVPDGGGKVEVSIPKNRGGRKLDFFLEIDDRTRVREVQGDEAPDLEQSRADETREDAEKVLYVIASKPGLHGKTHLRAAMRASGVSMGNDRVDAALERLLDEKRVENRGTGSRPELFAKGGEVAA